MLEAEIAFVDSLSDLLDPVEDGIKATIREILHGQTSRAKRLREDLVVIRESLAEDPDEQSSIAGEALEHLVKAYETPFNRVTYTQAINILLSEHGETPFEHPPVWGEGISSEQEKWLAGSYFDGPVFITDYPASIKPFYMLPSIPPTSPSSSDISLSKEETATVACFDLIFPGIGEMAGGSLREHRLSHLLMSMDKHKLDRQEYEWYLDLRRFGSVPHGGWGMGWERWVCWVSGVGNIRDVVAFPRWKGNCRY